MGNESIPEAARERASESESESESQSESVSVSVQGHTLNQSILSGAPKKDKREENAATE